MARIGIFAFLLPYMVALHVAISDRFPPFPPYVGVLWLTLDALVVPLSFLLLGIISLLMSQIFGPGRWVKFIDTLSRPPTSDLHTPSGISQV